MTLAQLICYMGAKDKQIRFLNMDGDMVETVKDNIKRNVDFPTQR